MQKMEEIHTEFEDTHDENAFLTGFLEFKSLKLYEEGDKIPTDKNVSPVAPCLVIEVFDEEESTAESKLMRPAHWIPINSKQVKLIKRYINMKTLRENEEMV